LWEGFRGRPRRLIGVWKRGICWKGVLKRGICWIGVLNREIWSKGTWRQKESGLKREFWPNRELWLKGVSNREIL
jgi:hypothetical protein